MGAYNNELEFKNHLPFFDNLNKDLNNLRQMAAYTMQSINNLPQYLDIIHNLTTHYMPYIEYAKINQLMSECDDTLYSIKFDTFIREFTKEKGMISKEAAKFYEEILKAKKNLILCHQLIMEGLHANELIPRLIDKPKRLSELEQDPDKKQFLKDIEQGGLI